MCLIVISVIVVLGFVSQKDSFDLGGAYLITAPTQATTSVGYYTDTDGNPTTIASENTARTNFSITPAGDIYIWLANATTTTMIDGGGSVSTGIVVASGTTWNMEDYGIIWPGIIYGVASSTTSTVQYTEFIGN